MDVMDFEFDRGFRVAGLLDFESRFPRFLEAHAPTVVHFHGGEWVPPALLQRVQTDYPALVTPAAASDPQRCAALYRRAAAGQ